MPEENLGSGLYLDQELDFDPSTTGDLRTVDGSEELQKDLAFQLLIVLSDYIGPPLTPGTRADIKSLTVDTITSDSRVDSIDRGSMQVTKPTPESIRVQVLVIADGDEQELVFNL
jgi:hypothetical protein